MTLLIQKSTGLLEYQGKHADYKWFQTYLRCSSTGSAGLIQMIQMYARGAIVAGVLGTVATVGWVVQGVGNAFYYREVSLQLFMRMLWCADMFHVRSGRITSPLGTQWRRLVLWLHRIVWMTMFTYLVTRQKLSLLLTEPKHISCEDEDGRRWDELNTLDMFVRSCLDDTIVILLRLALSYLLSTMLWEILSVLSCYIFV